MSTHLSRRSRSPRQAFTLIEILVVLAIAAIVSAITLGGFNEMRNGNKRTSCQTNLVQIYQAARQYAADEGGKFPLFATINAGKPEPPVCPVTSASNKGSGLWALYTFPNNNFNGPDEDRPIERYIRSSKVLHCPADLTHRSLYASGTSLYDTEYLSYQSCDSGVPTYASVRTMSTSDSTQPWQRQLFHMNGASFVARPPADSTVVTWCRHHRTARALDNVLFYDGSVQLLPVSQANPNDTTLPTTANMATLTDWRRKPKAPQ
jgi:prepilin-type N-terminal cleavage/methylation domain-containing protein